MAVCPLAELGYLRRGLAWILHTSMGTPTVRRVRARGLQQRRAFVGRVSSRGVQRCEISGLRLAQAPEAAHQHPGKEPAAGGQVLQPRGELQ